MLFQLLNRSGSASLRRCAVADAIYDTVRLTDVMVSGAGPLRPRRAQVRRERTTMPRPARPIASSTSDAGSGTAAAPIWSVKLSASAPVP